MAIVCSSEISSPRISFSHDLDQAEGVSVIEDHHDHRRLDSSLLESDFDFGIATSFSPELSSADELFSNGQILPVEIKKRVVVSTEQVLLLHQPCSSDCSVFPGRNSFATPGSSLAEIKTEKKRLKEFLLTGDFDEDDDYKPSSKPFWQFKRSSSLNCERIRPRGLIGSLQFLSRSKSTGSVPIPKPTQTQKTKFQKQTRKSKSSLPSHGNGYFMYSSSQKPPLKNNYGAYGNGVNRISPVLNFPPPPPFISNATEKLFAFGSLCNGKARKKKRS